MAKEGSKKRRKARRKELKKVKEACLMEEGTVNEEERARKRERKLNKRIRARKRRKEFREKREEERQNLQARRVQHFTVDHQTRTVPPAYRAKMWADLNYIWAQEEFNTVCGPNFNPDWITW